MLRLTHKTLFYGAAGALGGSAAWAFVLALSHPAAVGLGTATALGAVTGAFLGSFIWSHEAITGRQYAAAMKRAALGGLAGIIGGALGAGLGTLLFSALGSFAADLGGVRASLGVVLAVAVGWTVLGSAIGSSGGIMTRSRERALYGLIGGSFGGMIGGTVSGDVLKQNADKNFVDRIINADKYPSLDLGGGQRATHIMEWADAPDQEGKYIVYPTVVWNGKELIQYDSDTAMDHALQNKEYIEFDNPNDAAWFSERYKQYWGHE